MHEIGQIVALPQKAVAFSLSKERTDRLSVKKLCFYLHICQAYSPWAHMIAHIRGGGMGQPGGTWYIYMYKHTHGVFST